VTPILRPVWAEIDHAALRANVETLARAVAPAAVLAVVKADAYGHGAVEVARTALASGASALGVALVEEAVELRDAGVDAPIVVLSEPSTASADEVVARGITPVVYSEAGIGALAKAAAAAGTRIGVHLKVDTGMHRVGCPPAAARARAELIASFGELRLAGLMTHLAVADEPGHPYTEQQLDRFDAVVADLAPADGVVLHAANTAAAIDLLRARYDLVRLGIGLYGIPPSDALEGRIALRPVMSLRAEVTHVQRLAAGEGVSYGLRFTTDRPTTVATVPAGYADGVPRRLGDVGGEVLVRGRRCRIAGTVTMDQLMVDAGDLPVAPGDEVVLIGRQGGEVIEAAEWARRLDTIAYEIVCGIGPRVPRHHLGS
jgi:alanine racemase